MGIRPTSPTTQWLFPHDLLRSVVSCALPEYDAKKLCLWDAGSFSLPQWGFPLSAWEGGSSGAIQRMLCAQRVLERLFRSHPLLGLWSLGCRFYYFVTRFRSEIHWYRSIMSKRNIDHYFISFSSRGDFSYLLIAQWRRAIARATPSLTYNIKDCAFPLFFPLPRPSASFCVTAPFRPSPHLRPVSTHLASSPPLTSWTLGTQIIFFQS